MVDSIHVLAKTEQNVLAVHVSTPTNAAMGTIVNKVSVQKDSAAAVKAMDSVPNTTTSVAASEATTSAKAVSHVHARTTHKVSVADNAEATTTKVDSSSAAIRTAADSIAATDSSAVDTSSAATTTAVDTDNSAVVATDSSVVVSTSVPTATDSNAVTIPMRSIP